MEPFAVLIVLPVAVGAIAERLFRDPSRASLAAATIASTSVYACLHRLDPLHELEIRTALQLDHTLPTLHREAEEQLMCYRRRLRVGETQSVAVRPPVPRLVLQQLIREVRRRLTSIPA